MPEGLSDDTAEIVKRLVLESAYYLPSRVEFGVLWDVSTTQEGLRKLHELAPNATVIVKDGPNGAYYWKNGRMENVPAAPVGQVVNATGAGDSFNAGVITSLLQGGSVAEAAAYGCQVAAAKISAKA
jgi:2-dehydro-3-deoxygluconokinase